MRPLARIGAGIAGAVLLCAVMVFTLGTALIALLAVAAVYAVRRRRGRSFTRLQSWITAMVAAGIVVVTASAIFMTRRSPNGQTFWQSLDQSMQQAQAHPPPPPAFLRHLPRARPTPLSKSVQRTFTFIGLAMGVEMIGALFGSLAWGAGWLLYVAWRGRG